MAIDPRACGHCGDINCNVAVCRRIKSIEFFEDGTPRKIEYHAPTPINIGPLQGMKPTPDLPMPPYHFQK